MSARAQQPALLTRAALVGTIGWLLSWAPVTVSATVLATVTVILLTAVPSLAAAAAAIAVPLGTPTGLAVSTGKLTLVPLLVTLGCVGVAARLLLAGGRGVTSLRRASRPLAWVIATGLAYVAALTLSGLAAPAVEPAAAETARWVLFLLALALGFAAHRSAWSQQLLATALLCAGALASAIGLAWAWQGVGPPSYVILGGSLHRAFGTFGQPNPFGAYMNMVWPLGLGLVLSAASSLWRTGGDVSRVSDAHDRGRTGGDVSRVSDAHDRGRATRSSATVPPWLAVLGGIAALAALGGLAASWSRGAWLACACAGLAVTVVFLIRHARPPWPAWGVVGALASAALALAAMASGPRALAPDALVGRLASAANTFSGWEVADAEVTDANFATIERMAHWEAAVRMWSERPWLGQGPGHYEVAYARYRLPRWSEPLGHAHNYYLHALAESGLIGFAAYLGFLAALGAFALRLALRAGQGSMALAAALALVGALAAVAVHSVVDNVFVHDMTVTLGLLTGLAGAAEAASSGRVGDVSSTSATADRDYGASPDRQGARS